MTPSAITFDVSLYRILDRSGCTPMTAADISRAKSGPVVHPHVAQRIADGLVRLEESGEIVQVRTGRYVTARFNSLAA